MMDNKKVFISYSWGNSEHQEWVANLATRLMENTVDVVLDRWSLKDGHEVYSFMEEMVKAKDIFRVLIISDKKYAERADSRQGGVGTETQIITPNIYEEEKQEKFIPLVKERDEDGNPFLPIYLKGRKYIDFSREENYENSYEELLRNILEAPSLPKPKLGKKPPAYITESSVNLSDTNNKLNSIKNQIDKKGSVSVIELNNFIELFCERLWDFELQSPASDIETFGNDLVNNLISFKPLREDFIRFLNIISSNEIPAKEDIIIEFFEKRSIYESPRKNDNRGYSLSSFENFKIIFQELFLYTIAICLKNKDYELIANLFHSRYYLNSEHRLNITPEKFGFLYRYHENLEKYFRQKYNKITGFGHYVVTNLSESVSKQDLICADTLCYFASYLDAKDVRVSWFPTTYLYGERLGPKIFFEKMTSKKHFEKTKTIFNVKDKEELAKLLIKYGNQDKHRITYGSDSSEVIPFINELINPETIGIYR